MTPTITIDVDVTNPGQFFACCGLLEIAHRLTGEAYGWFERTDGQNHVFHIAAETSLGEVVIQLQKAPLISLDSSDKMAPPMLLGSPINMRLDWWKLNEQTSKGLKLWSGSMRVMRIAIAMRNAIKLPTKSNNGLFQDTYVVYEPNDPNKKVEPFCFDSRRGPNSHSRDIGFSPNDLSLESSACPAVEFLALVGIQRSRPISFGTLQYGYHLWTTPLRPLLIPAAITGVIPSKILYKFESWFRSGQKMHKAFHPAKLQ